MDFLKNVFFLWALILGMVVLMVIRINRSSTGMAVLTFFFWPAAVIPLFTNWGQRDIDIRIPFFTALAASVAIMYQANQLANQVLQQISEAELAERNGRSPYSAREIERQQLNASGLTLEQQGSGGHAVATLSIAPNRASPGAAGSAEAHVEFAPAPAQIHRTPLNELRFRRGQVRLAPAYAVLDVPEHFRFISVHQLGLLAEHRAVDLDATTLGWVVHERVDLNSPTFWFAEVQFHETGHLAPPADVDTPDPYALRWDALHASATTAQGAGSGREDLLGVKLLRHGALSYRVIDLPPTQRELGLRVVRLLSSRSVPETGWSHAEYTGPATQQSLQQWISAQQPAVQAELEPELESVEG